MFIPDDNCALRWGNAEIEHPPGVPLLESKLQVFKCSTAAPVMPSKNVRVKGTKVRDDILEGNAPEL